MSSKHHSQKVSASSPGRRLWRLSARLIMTFVVLAMVMGLHAVERGLGEQELRRMLPSSHVAHDARLGTVKWVRCRKGFLSGVNGTGRAFTAKGHALAVHGAEGIVCGFVDRYSKVFGFSAKALQTEGLSRSYTDKHNGVQHLFWQQHHAGIPIAGGVLSAHLSRRDELISIASGFIPQPADRIKARHGADAVVVSSRSCSGAAAITAVYRRDGITEGLQLTAEQSGDRLGHQCFRSAISKDPIFIRHEWLPVSDKELVLTWKVTHFKKHLNETWVSHVDVDTQKVIYEENLTRYFMDKQRSEALTKAAQARATTPIVVQQSGQRLEDSINMATPLGMRVYTSDSPSPFTPGHPNPSSDQPPVIGRQMVNLESYDPVASPDGWVGPEHETNGNNVDAHTDTNADNQPDLPRPQGSGTNPVSFDFPLDLSQSPSTYQDAAVTNLFYWCNYFHDRMYGLGFTEAAGNYQVDNFGRGGVGGDPILADAQDGSGTNNANFTPSNDGFPGRIQMYLWTGTTPNRDGDLDAQIIIHEYAHGLSNRLVGGPNVRLSNVQSRGMGEGWSDFYAVILLTEESDDIYGTYAVGSYSILGLFPNNYYSGIRDAPYTTDMSKNSLTLNAIRSNSAVHFQGTVWCTALHECYVEMVQKYGFVNGRELTLQLVTDGMKLSPANPNFVESRDAILQADLINNGGANHTELWRAFAKRGMGYSAVAGSSSTTSEVVEAYDVPFDLQVNPGEAFISAGSPGGPFSVMTKVYTLRNISANPLNWSAATDVAWADVSETSGTLAAGAATTVTVSLNSAAAALGSGSYAGQLSLRNSSTGDGDVDLPIQLEIGLPQIAASPSSLHFADTMVGSDNSLQLQLSNAGVVATTVTALDFGNTAFSTNRSLPFSIPVGGSETLSITFAPSSITSYSTNVRVTSNADNAPILNVPLSGEGIGRPELAVLPGSMNVTVRQGTVATRSLTLSNVGQGPLDYTINARRSSNPNPLYGAEHFLPMAKGSEDVRVGQQPGTNAGGPDAFGYLWRDSNDADGPTYQWQDISSSGTVLSASSSDDSFSAVNLSFAFPYYDQSYTTIYAGTNGYLTVGAGHRTYTNYSLPSSSAPPGIIAGWYDDLDPSRGGTMYFQDFGTHAIFQWHDVLPYSGRGLIRFQIVLNANGQINYYYNTISMNTASSTVGIQNLAQDTGLTVNYNFSYIVGGMAVEIAPIPDWLSANPVSGSLAVGASAQVTVMVDASELDLGDHQGALSIGTNDPNQTTTTVPVTAHVVDSRGPQMEGAIIHGLTEEWVTVKLNETYSNPVVLTSIISAAGKTPLVCRIKDRFSDSFAIRVQNVGEGTVSSCSIHYLVVEAGVYTEAEHGIKMEAVTFTSTVTDSDSSWVGMQRSYANSYSNPVVLGQVQSLSDSDWSVFWASDGNRKPPTASSLYVGKHVAEDADVTRGQEVLGYIVLEAGDAELDGLPYTAALGGNSIRGVADAPPYSYALSGLTGARPLGIVSSAGMNGGNGGWPVLWGNTAVQSGQLQLAIDEDQFKDSERNHIDEQVAYLVLNEASLGSNAIPVASGVANDANIGQVVNLDASGSTDADGDVLSFSWQQFDGPLVSLSGGDTAQASFTPTRLGQYQFQVTVSDGSATVTKRVYLNVFDPNSGPRFLSRRFPGFSDAWQTLRLPTPYRAPVIVATVEYQTPNDRQALVRIRNVTANAFDLRVQNPDGKSLGTYVVHFLIAEAGTYNAAQHGITAEVRKVTSTRTDHKGSWGGQNLSYFNTYNTPVVLGQVMSFQDSDWSTFWCRGPNQGTPPTASSLFVGKHVGEDSDRTRNNEVLGLIIVESGVHTVDGILLQAGVGSDTVAGTGNGAPYRYHLDASITAEQTVLSPAAMDGGDGQWPVLIGSDGGSGQHIDLAVDEDTIGDGERSHTTEQVGFIAVQVLSSNS